MVDVEYVQANEENLSDCGKGKRWFGYNYDSGGSVNTTLFGCGNASLNFGNCYESGKVLAYLNGIELGSVTGLKNKTIDFGFMDGDSIEIQENGGIILLNNFVQNPCPGESRIFIHIS